MNNTQKYTIAIFRFLLLVLILGLTTDSLMSHQTGYRDPNGSTSGLLATPTPPSLLLNPPTQHPAPGSVSPLIFGTDLAMYDTNDQFVNNYAAQQALKDLHVRFIRMPFRTNSPGKNIPESYNIKAMQAIKSIGAVPEIIIHTVINSPLADPTALSDDIIVLNDMANVFNTGPIYVDYGNEDDNGATLGLNQYAYTDNWNNAINQIKSKLQHPLFFKFGGPVNEDSKPTYLAYFAAHAHPTPDFVVWHEYTCLENNTTDECLANIQKWNTDIAKTRQDLNSVGKQHIPFIIDEWNYDPLAQPHDGRYDNPNFIEPWTIEAFNVLTDKKNNILASAHYVATDNEKYRLIDGNNNPTYQGCAFKVAYERIFGGSSSGTPPCSSAHYDSALTLYHASSFSASPRCNFSAFCVEKSTLRRRRCTTI